MKYDFPLKIGILLFYFYTISCSGTKTGEETGDTGKQNIKVILALSYKSTINALAGYPDDLHFIQALDSAAKLTAAPQSLVQSFFTIYNTGHPAKPLITFYKDQHVDSEEALQSLLLNAMEKKTIDMEDALRNRIRIIYAVDPKQVRIARNDNELLIEVPGVKDMAELKSVFTNREGIQVWALADARDLMPYLLRMNETYSKEHTREEPLPQTESEPSLQQLTEEGRQSGKLHLFSLLQPIVDLETQQPLPGPFLASADLKDTARINKFLFSKACGDLLPDHIRFMWGAVPGQDNKTRAMLLAITLPPSRAPLIDGSDIAIAQNSSKDDRKEITIKLNAKGSRKFERATAEHINKAIGIELDNYIYSAPTVQGVVSNGTLSIVSDFTDEAIIQQVKIMNTGTLPLPFRIKKIERSDRKP